MTSHPKDLSDELIEVMQDSKKICRHLHLPLQSGSSRILKQMNRRYTKEQYLELAEKIKTCDSGYFPDDGYYRRISGRDGGGLSGDPGCGAERYATTAPLPSSIPRRTGTPAAAMENQVPEDVVKDRFRPPVKRGAGYFCTNQRTGRSHGSEGISGGTGQPRRGAW